MESHNHEDQGNDPKSGPPRAPQPDQSMTIETTRIREPDAALSPNIVMVPVAVDPAPAGSAQPVTGPSKPDEPRRNDARSEGPAQDKRAKDDKPEPRRDQQAQSPSLTRILVYAGVVALVCGIIGAAGYSYFFGSGKSGDHKSSAQSSDSDKSSDSDNGSDSDEGSESGKGSNPGKGPSTSRNDANHKAIQEAQNAWMTAVKEMHQAREAEKEAKHGEDDTKAILDFLKRSLLSAGRSGDASMAEAFWSGGLGKDVTLRKAVDNAASKVSEAFADRPLAEAATREMLGLAYLNLGDAAQAVKQYERAYELRLAMQGADDSDSAACRNQLAVAYRLAGRPAEGSRLFDQDLHSPAQADALAVRGTMLLLEKKPAEAELKLRESLAIRKKVQPDDWTTFDTMSLLGQALMDQKKYAEAEPLLVQGYEGLKEHADAIPPREKRHLTQALDRLVKLYEARGQHDKAEEWRKRTETAETRQDSRTPLAPGVN